MQKRKITVEIAADWVAAVDAGLTPEQRRELDAWLAEHPSHRVAYQRLEGQYKAMDRLSAFRPANSDEVDADLPLLGHEAARHAIYGARGNHGAATPSSRKGSRNTAESDEPRRSARRWLWLPVALATAAVVAFAYTSWWRPAHGSIVETSSTAIGDLRRLELPDGSVVTLNTNSAVEVVYSSSERRVQLVKGEAHFAVAKNKDRPFIVGVGNVSVRAVGTAFNIRLRPEQIEVVVTEGLVQVDDTMKGRSVLPSPAVYQSRDFEEPVLAAGERVIIPMSAPPASLVAPPTLGTSIVTPVPETEITQRLAWREQRLVFDPTPLQDVVAEFNRYNRRQLRVADEATGKMLVGGTFKADDPETLVRLLESSFNLTADRREEVIILRRGQ